MQYAVMEVSGKRLLIDVQEMAAIETHSEEIADAKENEETMPLKVVYGCYKPQPGIAIAEALKMITTGLGYRHGHIDQRTCRGLEFLDVVTYTPVSRGYSMDVPFAALVRTHVEFPKDQERPMTFFLRYEGMNPATNILNRPGIYAITQQERRVKSLEHENWRSSIDKSRATKALRLAI